MSGGSGLEEVIHNACILYNALLFPVISHLILGEPRLLVANEEGIDCVTL